MVGRRVGGWSRWSHAPVLLLQSGSVVRAQAARGPDAALAGRIRLAQPLVRAVWERHPVLIGHATSLVSP